MSDEPLRILNKNGLTVDPFQEALNQALLDGGTAELRARLLDGESLASAAVAVAGAESLPPHYVHVLGHEGWIGPFLTAVATGTTEEAIDGGLRFQLAFVDETADLPVLVVLEDAVLTVTLREHPRAPHD